MDIPPFVSTEIGRVKYRCVETNKIWDDHMVIHYTVNANGVLTADVFHWHAYKYTFEY